MECVTEPWSLGIPPIKVIAPIGKHSDRTIWMWKCFGLHFNCDIDARREKEYTHYIGDWQYLISMFFYILKKYNT